MHKITLKCLLAALLLVSCFSAEAQVSAPKYSNEFLNLGVGARALGMGNVQVAITSDATSGYWNPAGLLRLPDKYNIALMHSELFAGIAKNDFASFAMPIDTNSALAVSVIRLGVDDIADTRRLQNEFGYIQYDSVKFFSVADYAVLLSYARRSKLIEGLQLGASAKIVYRNVGNFANAWGFGVDAGAQLQRGNWQFGVMGKDITTTFTAWTHNVEELEDAYAQTGNDLPENSAELTLPRIIVGAGRNFQINDKFSALVSTDIDFTFDGKRNVLFKSNLMSVDPHIGVELVYSKSVFIRGGLSNYQQTTRFDGSTATQVQPNFGVGFVSNGFNLDLALSRMSDREKNSIANANTSSVIISMGYSFR
ncbi:PorV/PorQ family protein [Pontibacter sp. BT310]|uniref:PorV/PorQ family protein n=1 Tax=Pontibacter populi TaxID=890055 RepID=A0ABS6XC43_9BACT|nr:MULTISPECIES: PorV/PorQ family protein [Pontibacter]MBJ6118572.1 PorV/PorQ family protein [Pontibacter sp. BT310]MBR0571001.1 PorV/PorQ family protein [Microvirga sp. STS03]MBW3365426.1 PorV/PorQ family protein [Pontibacter populi]